SEANKQVLIRTLLLAGESDKVAGLLSALRPGAEGTVLRGLNALVAGRPKEALESLETAAEQDAQDAFTPFLLGLALARSSGSDKAIAAYRRAIALPDTPNDAFLRLGKLLADGNR